jgi:cell division protein FtsN
MKISDWAKQAISLAIASWGFWNVAIANANAQLGNIVVYVVGNNPVTLSIARQVVTNPVVASVNGQTSIVAGAFDAPTADFVSRELQRRGVAAQQAYTSQIFQPTQTVSTSPYVTLPSYLPNNNIENSAQYRYVTAVPMRAMATLAQVRQFIPTAFVAKSVRGDYIYAGGYPNRDAAESLKHFLRSQGIDARVLYF